MPIRAFPSHELATAEGILALGGDLEIESLKLAYENGIFPWPHRGLPLLWFSPPQRAILEFADLKIPRRMARELRQKNFRCEVDLNFRAVIEACAQGATRASSGTWITAEMIEAYVRFHQAGFAHSFETYDAQGNLVGGMYGVAIGGLFAGESMFYHEPGASKAALLFAIRFLSQRGATWMDIQTLSPLLETLGAKEIAREDFLERLYREIRLPSIFAK